jgi:hypothetical protein
MTYLLAHLHTDEQRQALCRLWRANSYDPEANARARERFDWRHRPGGDHAVWYAGGTVSR